jgi:hypothetical protein
MSALDLGADADDLLTFLTMVVLRKTIGLSTELIALLT